MDIIVFETCRKVTIECGVKYPKPSHEANIVVSKQVKEENELVGRTELWRTRTSSSGCSSSEAFVRLWIDDSFGITSVSNQGLCCLIIGLQAGMDVHKKRVDEEEKKSKQRLFVDRNSRKWRNAERHDRATSTCLGSKPCTTSHSMGIITL